MNPLGILMSIVNWKSSSTKKNNPRVLGIWLASIIITCTLHPSCNADDKVKFDVAGTYKASEILPANLVKNELFTVREDVLWFDGLNQFTVDTEFGSFDIWGEPMLRVRLREFIAWNTLNEVSAVEAGARSVARETIRDIDSLLMAFAHPITTIQGIPVGISRLFRQTGRDLNAIAEVVAGEKAEETPGSLNRRGDEEVGAATKTAEILVGVNKSYRLWAQKVGVNPYTTNTALKDELNRVAKMDAYLGTSTKLLVPDIIKGNLKVVAKVSESIYDNDWHGVVRNNEIALKEMNVDEKLIDYFLKHDFINLTLATLIVESLAALEGVDNRSRVIDQAVLLKTESEAIWFTESVMMAQWFHQHEAPIAEMLPDTLVPVALTQDGRVIMFSAADNALWTEDVANLSVEFTSRYESYSDRREVWVADQVSPRFVEGVAGMGWKVHSGIRGTVLSEIPWGLQDDGK